MTTQTKAPGKAHRKGMTLLEVAAKFKDNESALKWLEEWRWPDGSFCPHCGSFNVQCGIKHKTMTHRCRDCPNRAMFTIRKGTVMEGTKMSYQTWAIGIYLFSTNIKGISSMKLHRELGIGQKAAWFMLQRLRKALEVSNKSFSGPVEVDEAYMGGKRKNMSNEKRKELAPLGRGGAGKTAVAGIKDRKTNKVTAQVVKATDRATLVPFVEDNVEPGAEVYTDEAAAYKALAAHYGHESVNHGISEYVREKVRAMVESGVRMS